MEKSVDYLAICAHPDDAELTCAGLLLCAQRDGASVGVVDLTQGELGSRGTPETRSAEAARAADILGLDERINMNFTDGDVQCTRENLLAVVSVIRRLRPRVLITSYWEDHHPDHVQTSKLASDAWWFAGVAKFPADGAPHRPERLLYYQGRGIFKPSLVVDISEVWEKKIAAIECYHSQLHSPSETTQPSTYTSTPDFIKMWEGRHRYIGSLIGVRYGEAYHLRTPVPIFDIQSITGGVPGVL